MMSSEFVPSATPLNMECEEEDNVLINGDGESESESESEEEVETIELEQGVDIVEEPNEEMMFHTLQEAYLYYSKFAKDKGFAVAKRTSRKGKDGDVTDCAITCTRAGKARVRTKNPVKPQPQAKIGCEAHVTVVKQEDGKWKFNVIVLKHNHDLSPSKSRYFKSNRVLSESVKRQLELNDKAGIRMYKTFDALQIEAGGRDKLSFLKKDCRNYLDKQRRLRLKEGDAEAMYNYFARMKDDNESFYFAMDLDDKGRLRNVFWADARSRAACKEFGDVVTFDTTYLVNKYNMPFAPFVGVNHHGQSTLLGCGLISKEDTESFMWLFKTWKRCMFGCAPNAIITDQCMAMKNAIEIIFPDTRHRWCIWHIMKKLPEKFGGYEEFKKISWSMRAIVYDSLTIEQFENAWATFTKKYKLEGNSWLEGLYLEKKRWVPAFLKDVFWAGMSSTQRSESMNHYFDDYIHSRTTLKQFVEQYENALESKVEKENQEDVNCFTTFIPLVSKSELEKQIQGIYTHQKVREFQAQILAKCDCVCLQTSQRDIESEFEVKQEMTFGEGEEEWRKEVSFTVTFHVESNEVHCTCRLFEFRGMVCTHQLMVWQILGIKRMPDKYVLRTWCKNVKRVHTKVPICYNKSSSSSQARRHDHMCNLFKEVADLADGYEEIYSSVIKDVQKLKLKVVEALKASEATVEVEKCVVSLGDDLAEVEGHGPFSLGDGPTSSKLRATILDPECVKRKGRPPTKRKVGAMEKVIRKKRQTKKKLSPNAKTKDVEEIAVDHHLGTQECVANTMGHPNYMGYSMWPNMMSYHVPLNTTQDGTIFPITSQGKRILQTATSMNNLRLSFPSLDSLFDSQLWMSQYWRGPHSSQDWRGPHSSQDWGEGQSSVLVDQTQGKGCQKTFMDMMNEMDDDDE